MASNVKLHIETALWKSRELSKKMGCSVWLKLENFQNSGSFKTRGLGHFCQKAVDNGCKEFVSSSGGNAGLAAVFCAEKLGIPITVVVPTTTLESVREKMKDDYGATVVVHGKNWNEANEEAMKIRDERNATLVHPFDHPDTWDGHASIMEEVKEQLGGVIPDLVVVSVGGGGLLCGVLEGLHRVGWKEVCVLAMETEGPGGGLNACAKAKEWVTLDDNRKCIDPCLGVKRVCKRSFEWLSQHPVVTHVVPERSAVEACSNVAKDHRFLLQPACGVALASIYSGSIKELQKEGRLPQEINNIVVIVCGGSLITVDEMKRLEDTYL